MLYNLTFTLDWPSADDLRRGHSRPDWALKIYENCMVTCSQCPAIEVDLGQHRQKTSHRGHSTLMLTETLRANLPSSPLGATVIILPIEQMYRFVQLATLIEYPLM
ncbi:hypothetical protein J6590_053700 [Homalodisca vitripennis]|nr:hypothetical protein J6590_053700 [Homalodisca vitripennis]